MPLLLVWAGIVAGMALHRMPSGTIRALTLPAVGPLWFLAVFVVLTAATPLLLRPRPGVTAVVAGAVVLGVDVVRFWLDGPAWLKWANLAAGWLVPYVLGIAWANGAFASRRAAAGLLTGGTAGAVVLIAGFGYPASMVGVTGAEVSNLSPPTLAAVCFGIAQVGLALLVRAPLTRLMRRPGLWAVVALARRVRDDDLPVAPDRADRDRRDRAALRRCPGAAVHARRADLAAAPAGLVPGARRTSVDHLAVRFRQRKV